ncbi:MULTISPECIES: 3-hydroxyacyl-CoA dehydrogenase NAD-binding domain-containing protein [unclassified Streptomyces]
MTAAITRVGVVGSGLMASGIAEVRAKAGLDVRVVVSRPAPPRR